MRKLLRTNLYFIIPQLIFLVAGLVMLYFMGSEATHIYFNEINSPFLDQFFKYLTHLGDGLVFVPMLLFFLMISYRKTIAFALGIIISNIFVQSGKHLFFPEALRPSKYFEEVSSYELHLVEGVDLHSYHSFPSGHTATAFLVLAMLAMLSRNNWVKVLCFALAVFVSFSRVYLSQHFLEDIIVGSVIGTLSMFFAWLWMEKSNKQWLDSGIARKNV
ncbi:MAG: hypothetical protein C0592_02660 [Marinilabiliales bacterium]|nr:MAG: hypothetical protein C0592_02660 [Marinilabiliales bacterium]